MTPQQTANHFPLEDELQADSQGVLRRQLLKDLAGLLGQIKRVLDGGVAPAEFERVCSLHNAVNAATAVVEKVWQRFHPA